MEAVPLIKILKINEFLFWYFPALLSKFDIKPMLKFNLL